MKFNFIALLGTPQGRRFVRVALTVGLGIPGALAPLLGTQAVPYFEPLVSVLSRELRGTVIPFSIVIVTVVAVVLEFQVRERITARARRWLFGICLLSLLAAIGWLFSLQTSHVRPMPIERGQRQVWIVITPERRAGCPCGDLPDLLCVHRLTLDPARLELCWGGPELQRIQRQLAASYLVTIFLLVALIGIAVLKVARKPRGAKRPRRETKRGSRAGKSPAAASPATSKSPTEG